MNIHELDSYNLGDAVKFNDKLNPRIWGADERMLPEVREQLLRIADDFREFLGIDVEVKDITVSGSNAAYTYTPHSDIDLHLVVDLPKADASDVYRELFDAKKYAYNDMHNIKIGGSDVELYVQDANKKHHSQGIYSIVDNDWISVPKRKKPDVDDISVKSKFEDLGHRIEAAVKSQDYEKISALTDKLKDYRQAGLDAHGEFGPENLAFKILRTQGLIKKLYDARNAAKDKVLSLDERRKKKKRKSVKYGYGAYWYPGTAYAGQDHPAGSEGGGDGGGESMREDAGMTWDGVNPTTDMFTSEDATMTWDGVNPSTAMFTTETQDPTDEEILQDFIDFCVKELKIEQMPRVKLRRDPQWPAVHKTFGRYNDELKTLEVAWGQRHIMDVLRTVAHELTHKHQHEREGERMGPDAGETGSPYENEANARAGVLMRDYGRLHPEYFTVGQAHDLEESASGYIPTRAQARDPRYSMALTVDIKPGQVGKEANKLKLKTDRQGHPQIARANGLFENLYKEYKRYKAKEDYSPDEPPGPEFKPTMPAGTLRVDVSDVYDWYKLGQHISRMKGLGQHDFGKGPPSTIISFGDEDTEHEFIGDIEATGLDVTDIDPKDPKKRPGRKIKTDPTYNVDEAIQAPVSKEQRAAEDYYRFIVGKIKLGRVLNRQEQEFFKTYNLKKKLAEFAPSPGYGGDGDDDYVPRYLVQYANAWWNAADPKEQKYIEDQMATGGWTIRQIDDDTVLLNHKEYGITYRIRDDQFDPDLFETNEKLSQYLKTKLNAQSKQFAFQGYRVVYEPTQVNVYKGADLVYTKKGDYSQPNKANLQSARSMIGTLVRTQQRKDAINPDLKDQQAVNEDEDLDEVKMSPGALEKFAASDAAKGIRAGFEAELIFRDTQGESEELDPEPNYDADERCYSIQQVIDFFSNDEYGYGLSDRAQNRLMDDLDERYMEWRDEQIISDFRNDAEDLIRDILLEETPMDQRIHFYLTDSLQMSDEEADAVIKAGADAPRFTNSDAQKDYADENPEYKTYLEAADEAEQELEESVEFSVNRQDEYWDEALDKYRDDYSGDDDSFFSDVGLRWMSDVANEFNLDWPVWDGGEQQNYGSRGWEDIGNSLQDAVDMPVVVSSNYHSTRRRPGQWIIEPDGSLDPDDKSEEAGLEIVSPPMPLLTAIEKLRAVTDWANDPNGGNAYTNSSTGLHMGVSLPSMASEAADDDAGIDYVKLILFMGDKYVQQQFGREANTYCASALDKLKQNIKGKKSDPAGVVKLLQHGLTELAHKELQKGVGTSKYTSAHIQPGYIEFRSPGGDWLAKADEEIGVLENTMLRFARAMAIAGDPNAERQEYAKKLYKLVTTDNPEYADQLKLFSEFSAGTINKEQLKKQWADTVLQKELPSVGKDEYEVYRRDNGDSPDATVGTLYARDYDDAYDQFIRQYGRDINNLDVRIKQPWFDVFDDKGKIVKTIRAKDIETATERAQYEFGERWTDSWNIYRRPDDTPEPKASPRAQVAKRIATKPRTPTQYNYEIVDQRTLDLKAIDRFYAANDQEASRVFDQWLKMKNLPNDTANYGYRQAAKTVSDNDASDWEAVYVPTGHVFDTLAHADAEQAATWAQSMGDAVRPEDIQVRRVGHQQAADARRDSTDLQRNLGVRDVDIDVTQNFEPQQSNWEIYQSDDPSRIVNTLIDATERQVQDWLRRQETQGMPPGFLSARRQTTTESIHQPTPEQTQEIMDAAARELNFRDFNDAKQRGSEFAMKTIQHLATAKMDLAQKQPFSMLSKKPSSIKQAVDQVDLANMTRQIQTARKLGDDVNENFADKKVSGKSRPGRVKRAGASCKGSVTDLRARAKKYGGEKGKMYHWCANMKSGRKK